MAQAVRVEENSDFQQINDITASVKANWVTKVSETTNRRIVCD